MRAKVALRIAALGLGLSLMVATPALAYGNGGAPIVTTNTSTGSPGGSLLVTGNNFVPNEGITLLLHSTPVTLGTTTADSIGTFSITVTIPTNTSPGVHQIVAAGATGDSATTTLTVEGTVPVAATSGLAFTGADVAAVSGIGALALALGGVLILVSRRKRSMAKQ